MNRGLNNADRDMETSRQQKYNNKLHTQTMQSLCNHGLKCRKIGPSTVLAVDADLSHRQAIVAQLASQSALWLSINKYCRKCASQLTAQHYAGRITTRAPHISVTCRLQFNLAYTRRCGGTPPAKFIRSVSRRCDTLWKTHKERHHD